MGRSSHAKTMSDEVEIVGAEGKKKLGRPAGSRTRTKVVAQRKASKVLDLKARGLSVSEIAGATALSQTRVKDILRQFRPVFTELENNENYQHIRRDLLSATELALLKSLNDKEKIGKSTLNGAAYAFKQVFDARRLESNLSTANVATQTIAVTVTPGEYSEE